MLAVTGLDVFLVWVEFERLLVDHFLKDLLGRLEVIPGPIEGLLAFGLGFFIMKALEVGMLQALLYCVALLWVEHEHLA